MNSKRNCIYIPSIDAKDLYLSNNLLDRNQNKIGYRLLTQNGTINFNRFINSFDFSLDSEQLRLIAKKVYTKKDIFTFKENNKEYSDKIINVTFKYSCRHFNKICKDIYIMEGYLYQELHFDNNIAVHNNMIVGIITSAPSKQKTIYELPSDFICKKTENGNFIYEPKNIKLSLSTRQLRDYLYENGFNCNGYHYVRFKRTSGSARVGKCLFIEESLYSEIHKWEMCGLEINNGELIDLAALESYISLSTSSAIDTLQISPKSILIIPDYNSNFQEDSIIVSMDKNKRISVNEGVTDISNSIFDGQSLIDKSVLNVYSQFGMVLLRNRFFKSCCFNTNIQQWFSDNNISDISQLHKGSITLAKKIQDIKLITTPSSIKYIKFAPLLQWLNNIDSTFSIVKHEKKTNFFKGKMVQAHYQLLNTLQMSKDDIHTLLKPSLDYVNLLNTDDDVLKYHVKCSSFNNSDSEISNVMKNKNNIVYTMMKLSKNFFKTKYFYDFKKETCKAYLKNLKKGHILIDGNYSVLFGNPYEMLLHAIGKFDGNTSLPPGYIHTTRYSYGKKILGCRSPHISTSNILISTNIKHDLIDKYFNITDEIVCINSINENILERLSGADFDSDQMIITDNKLLINAALKNYDIFKVPSNCVSATKSKRYYSNAHKSDLDYKTSENKIGEIVNLSQELNTIMWDYINKSNKSLKECYDEIKNIYYDICILNVLSCIEIDKAKKEFDISSVKEIHQIKEKWIKKTFDNKSIKPAFLGYISQIKGYRNPEKKKYNYHETTMDYLLKEINQYRSTKTSAKNFVSLSSCFKFEEFRPNSVNWKQINKIIHMCETTTTALNTIWSQEYYTNEEKYILSNNYKENLIFEINRMKINPHTMYILLTYTDDKKHSHVSKLLFYLLFHYKNSTLIQIMKSLSPSTSYIKECSDGELELHGIKFKRYGGNTIE